MEDGFDATDVPSDLVRLRGLNFYADPLMELKHRCVRWMNNYLGTGKVVRGKRTWWWRLGVEGGTATGCGRINDRKDTSTNKDPLLGWR